MYYTSEEYFKNKFDSTPRHFAFRASTKTEYEAWKQDFRPLLAKLLGFEKMTTCDPNTQYLSKEKLDGYTREKIIINTEPGIQMPFYVLKPECEKVAKWPIAFALHGHSSNGKNAVCGITNGDIRLADTIKEFNYDYGVTLVRQGFIVFCPDARGFGERAEKYKQGADNILDSSCANLNAMAYPLGMNVTGMWTWDLICLLDYALARDDTDCERVNSAGLSGGGLQSLWFAAMDERVKNVIISGYFYGYKQALLECNFNCSCNYIPGLWENADMGDIAALIANRGIFIETGDEDFLNGAGGLDNVYPQVETVKTAAKILNNEKNIHHHVFNGGHRWNGENTIPWLSQQN